MKKLMDLIFHPFDGDWDGAAREAFESLFEGGRYGKRAASKVHPRINASAKPNNVPFAALISPDQPDTGPYGGMSFVLFPSREDRPGLVSLVVGTNGLQPDEEILSRPGHARKCAALSRWLNHRSQRQAVWAKRDPSRIDLSLPQTVQQDLRGKEGQFEGVIQRYGHVIYLLYMPPKERDAAEVEVALRSFLDLFMEERGQLPLKGYHESYLEDQRQWLEHVLPDCDEGHLADLLGLRRYVILEGPPGTGKTRMARRLLAETYQGRGMSIQFHPSTTYEEFVGGLAPVPARGEAGLQFSPKPGFLMEAVRYCLEKPDQPFLLHVDEINRADLSKVLGEAVFLFEVDEPDRVVQLAHDFGADFRQGLRIPQNLHLLGTMNSADRSIAILDLAIRRRFAFVRLWPQAEVVKRHGESIGQEAFHRLFRVFLEFAPDEAFDLMPGHGYFLVADDRARDVLSTGVAPLLQEYLKQGYVAGFEDEIRAYLDWLDAL